MWLRGLLIIVAILAKPLFVLSETDNANEERKDIQTNQDYSARADEIPVENYNDNPDLLITKTLPTIYENGEGSMVLEDSVPPPLSSEAAPTEPCLPMKSVIELLDLVSKGDFEVSSKDLESKLFKLQDRPEQLSEVKLRELEEDIQNQPDTQLESNSFTETDNKAKGSLVQSLVSSSQHGMSLTEDSDKQDMPNIVSNARNQTGISFSVAKSSNSAWDNTSPKDIKAFTDQLLDQSVKLQNKFSATIDKGKSRTSNLSDMSSTFIEHNKAETDVSSGLTETEHKLLTQHEKLLPSACSKEQLNVQISDTKPSNIDVQRQYGIFPKLKSSYDKLHNKNNQVDLVSTQFSGSSNQFDTSFSTSSQLFPSQSEPFSLLPPVPTLSTDSPLDKAIPSYGSGEELDLSKQLSGVPHLNEPVTVPLPSQKTLSGKGVKYSQSNQAGAAGVVDNEWLKNSFDESNSTQYNTSELSDILPSTLFTFFSVTPFPKDQNNRPWSEKIISDSEKSSQTKVSMKQFEVPEQSQALLPNLNSLFWAVFNQTQSPVRSDIGLLKQPEEPVSNYTDYTRSDAGASSDQFTDLAEKPEVQLNRYSSIEIEDLSPDQPELLNPSELLLSDKIGSTKPLERSQAEVTLEQSPDLLKQTELQLSDKSESINLSTAANKAKPLLNQYGSIEIEDLSPDQPELLNPSGLLLPDQIGSPKPLERSQTEVTLEHSPDLLKQTELQLSDKSESINLSTAANKAKPLLNQYGSIQIEDLSPDQPELLNPSELLLPDKIGSSKALERSQTEVTVEKSPNSQTLERSWTELSTDQSSNIHKQTELQLSDESISQPIELSTLPSHDEPALKQYNMLLKQHEVKLPCDSKLKVLQTEIDYYRALLDEFRTNGFKALNSRLRLGDLSKPKLKVCVIQDVSNPVVQQSESGEKHDNDVQLGSQNGKTSNRQFPDESYSPGESFESQDRGRNNSDGALPNPQPTQKLPWFKPLTTISPKTKTPHSDLLEKFIKDILVRALPLERQNSGEQLKEKLDPELKEEAVSDKPLSNRRFGVIYPELDTDFDSFQFRRRDGLLDPVPERTQNNKNIQRAYKFPKANLKKLKHGNGLKGNRKISLRNK